MARVSAESRRLRLECRACRAEKQRLRHAKEPEAYRARARARYAAAPDRAIDRARQWQAENRESVRIGAREYKVRRRERVRVAACAAASPSELRALVRVCQYCGGPPEHLDHIVPISRGGCSALHNLTWACASCNLQKGAKTPAEWCGLSLPGCERAQAESHARSTAAATTR